MAGGNLELQDLASLVQIPTVPLMMNMNDVSRGESRMMTKLPEKVSCLLQETRI